MPCVCLRLRTSPATIVGRLSRTKGDNCHNDYRTFVLTCEHYYKKPVGDEVVVNSDDPEG
jgi:hypothetical protein